jgi:hypothetical protein
MSAPSTAMRYALPVICLSLLASLAYAAEEPQQQPRQALQDPGDSEASSEAAADLGPAVDTSNTSITRPPANNQQADSQSAASAQRAGGPQAVVRNDRLQLDTTVVTGNRELPKVLYIVPWKKSDLGELPAQPFNTLLDEALMPIDRDVFRREVTYYGAIAAHGGEGADAAPVPAGRSEK